MTDRSGPSRGANKNTSILGANNISPRYIPPKTTIPLYTLNILDNHLLDVPDARERYGVSGDVLRRLVFFIFVVRILVLGHMEAISWNNEIEWSGVTISKSFCTFLLHQTNASLPLCVTASPTRQGIVAMLGLGRGGSQFYIP